MICAACDKELKAPEASGFLNQNIINITVSLKADTKDSLPVHVCNDCKKELKKSSKVLHVATVSGKAPGVSIR